MHPKRKTAQIDRLAGAIAYIATDFERFGSAFLDALLEIPMDHKGTNLLGFPIAGVVDTVSDDGRIAAEYSAEKDYFDGEMTKAERDLLKAVNSKPSATEIFLLSGQRKRPQKAQDFETRMGARHEMLGRTLHLWGSEEIASKLVEELLFSDAAIRKLSPYLPELQRVFEEEAASSLAPRPDRTHIDRQAIDAGIAARLEAQGGVAISGIGGIGKSAAAAAYADRHQDDFDLVIWLEGREVQGVQSLHALPLYRGGEQRNIAALLRTRACLLIIDDADPTLTIAALKALCGARSRVILTQRLAAADSYPLPMLDRADAQGLLAEDVQPCPAEVFEVIWETVNGHPLTLGLMNAAVRQGASWADIETDCRAVGDLPDDRGQPLADRLLSRLRPALERELSVFAWAEQPACAREFLDEIILPLGMRKLRANGLMSVDRTEISRLHDIVFAALAPQQWCSPERREELDQALASYLLLTAGESGLRFWITARVLRPKLELLVSEGNANPVFRYALLAIWDTGELRPELVSDPVVEAEALRGRNPAPLAVLTVIEAIEQLFLFEKRESDTVAADRLRERLIAFDTLAALPGLSDLEVAQIRHHKGKALKRLGETEAAAILFEEVLAGPAPISETRLQLIDVYRTDRTKVARAVALADQILTRSADSEEVSYSVFLGAVERLPWGGGAWRSDLIRKHASAIENTIVEAAELGVQQAYRTFGAVGRYLSTEEPALFSSIFGRLTKPSLESLESDDDKFSWGEIYFEASRLAGADKAALQSLALSFYQAEANPQRFHLQRKAELLIDMGKAAEAEGMLRARDDLERSEWIQRLMARARLTQGDAADALHWIDRALEGLRAEHFRSEFLELRYDIRSALNDANALDDLKLARDASQKKNETARLAERLRQFGVAEV